MREGACRKVREKAILSEEARLRKLRSSEGLSVLKDDGEEEEN